MRPKDDWDLADERGEQPTRSTFVSGPRGWEAVAGLDAERAEAIRRRLAERLAQLQGELSTLEKEVAPRDEGPRPQYGKRVGDHTSDALELRRLLAATDALRAQEAEVRRALAKVDDGTYGRCDGCGEPVGDERLAALPWAAECVACRSRPRG